MLHYLRALILFILLNTFYVFGFSQNIFFNNQVDVDNFDASIINFPHSIYIMTSPFTSDFITDLSNLSNLKTIGGDVFINSNNALSSLNGLHNLDSIGGHLSIHDCGMLTNINVFNNLEYIGGGVEIHSNPVLNHIGGFNNLSIIGEQLEIYNNQNLVNINGFDNLLSTNGNFVISSNPNLSTISAFNNLNSITGSLEIRLNHNLSELLTFNSLDSLGGTLEINQNTSLVEINDFTNLSIISGNLEIKFNSDLLDLNGFDNLNTVNGSFSIYDNSLLSDCCIFQNILSTPDAIFGTINITDNAFGCNSKQEINETACDLLISSNPPCLNANNGSIQVQIFNDNGPFSYTWQRIEDGQTGTGTTEEINFIIENLAEGTYELIVTDALGEEFTRSNISMMPISGSVFEIIELTTTNASNGFSNGFINITVEGGTPPYDYSWTGTQIGTSQNINETNFSIVNLAAGEYSIYVSDDIGNSHIISIVLLDDTVPVFPCTAPLDIVILNDVSGSVDAVEYQESKEFFVNFINAANIGMEANDNRAAIIEWSGGQSLRIPITGNLATLQNYLNHTRAFSGSTNPHSALSFGGQYLATNARPEVEKVLILSTDGSSGQISPSLVGLADQFKAAGYNIITIAFDDAFSNNITRDILKQISSFHLPSPGAPAYSLLDENLAENIVNVYLCPIDPGSSATVYFNRDGAIDIIDIETLGDCPMPNKVNLTFTLEALRELSIPSGTPVTFYYNNPALVGATSILTWQVPCAIPVETIDTFTVSLPVMTAANIFAVLNDSGNESPPITFPITNITELAYSNNVADTTICIEPLPTLQAFKYASTPQPICNDLVIYTVNVCNISDLPAEDVMIMDDAPNDFVLLSTVVNDNNCVTADNDNFSIAGGCCLSLTYTYDVSNAPNGNYNDQDVELSGAINQIYLDFDGALTTTEDVLIDGNTNCPSTEINFIKTVNTDELCEDGFVVYTFTIDNQLNVPLQGISFSDILPAPVTWTFQPYNLNGLSIGNPTIIGGNASFVIDEVTANTVATFSMDAYIGDWIANGILENTATLENVLNAENSGLQTLVSNTTSTNVLAEPEISVSIESTCEQVVLSATINNDDDTDWNWVAVGDGIFMNTDSATSTYIFGEEDLANGIVTFSVSANTECGAINEFITVNILETPEPVILTLETCEGTTVEFNGITLNIGDEHNFMLEATNGCDSIISVSVIGLLPDTEELILETCDTNTVDYNGITFNAGDTQSFTFQNMAGCDSIVSVSVVGQSSDAEELILETCENNTVEYNGIIFNAGDTQSFTFQNMTGCDSTVSVSVIGLSIDAEELILETCENNTIEYNGITFNAGDSQSFTFQNSNGCDSTIFISVESLPQTQETIVIEVCPQETVDYHGVILETETQNDFLFINQFGCDSIISVQVLTNKYYKHTIVPNIFSPNKDGINDCFQPYFAPNFSPENYQFSVFSRWGNLVFSSTNPAECWDGNFNGQLAMQDVFVWFIKFKSEDCNEVVLLEGDVTLIR